MVDAVNMHGSFTYCKQKQGEVYVVYVQACVRDVVNE